MPIEQERAECAEMIQTLSSRRIRRMSKRQQAFTLMMYRSRLIELEVMIDLGIGA